MDTIFDWYFPLLNVPQMLMKWVLNKDVLVLLGMFSLILLKSFPHLLACCLQCWTIIQILLILFHWLTHLDRNKFQHEQIKIAPLFFSFFSSSFIFGISSCLFLTKQHVWLNKWSQFPSNIQSCIFHWTEEIFSFIIYIYFLFCHFFESH